MEWQNKVAAMALRPLYAAYELRLMRQVTDQPMPRHIGLILDGNRRFGHLRGVTDPREIYMRGAAKLDEVLAWCDEFAIGAVTLWVCSTDNLARPPEQVTGILQAVEAKLSSLVNDVHVHRRRIRVQTIGRRDCLPASTREVISAAERATAHYNQRVLTIAIAYGGREEIVDAVRALLEDCRQQDLSLRDAIERVTPESISRYLYLANMPEPDLLIRTSGEVRLSGFLLWQSAYSEFYFSDALWPAFRKIDFLRAVRAFQQRRRRFGL
ncbi:MAG: di-trans,poly-cis-decaprenylcistransferase [Acetobacteraceae bacterium]|nr:di-trans,poly-cis-decaprenylcistransferase [Acetobacteraceae bacterium]